MSTRGVYAGRPLEAGRLLDPANCNALRTGTEKKFGAMQRHVKKIQLVASEPTPLLCSAVPALGHMQQSPKKDAPLAHTLPKRPQPQRTEEAGNENVCGRGPDYCK